MQHIPTPPKFAQPYGAPTINQPRAKDFGSGSIKDEVIKIFRQTFGIDPKGRCRSYQRPYPDEYEHVAYSHGFKIPELLLNSLMMIVELH